MQRYGGTLIHHCRDEFGALEIVDVHGILSLHFGTPPKQSARALDDPDHVELPYIRAMLGGLAFGGDPQRVLILGLGGGTLASCLLGRFEHCRIDAVELRPQVVELAHRFFALPRDPRLTVHIGDAAAFVRSPQRAYRYDLILVDAYNQEGMDHGTLAAEFFESCGRLLSQVGVLVINLWGTHRVALHNSTELLRRFFPRRCRLLPVPNRGNIVGFGLPHELTMAGLDSVMLRARELEIRLGVELPSLLMRLKVL